MDKTKCITFDKAVKDALPEDVKAKMKANQEKSVEEKRIREMSMFNPEHSGRFWVTSEDKINS